MFQEVPCPCSVDCCQSRPLSGLPLRSALPLPRQAAAASEIPIVVTSKPSKKAEWAHVTCPSGTGLVGGGYEVHPTVNGMGQVTDFIQANTPSDTEPNTWAVKSLRGERNSHGLQSVHNVLISSR
ncbi:hypothetical protein V5N34_27550 [Streptomyces baarnensis]|uniref:hypothetical protein n=1 Tax=Streptomyces TaxID=1883 RepID=UPI0029AECA6C|nr:hypothetical protein [Streptomyces sp. ME02-6979.5a]MDX3342570.1 hypothetical protein [Streptomyces sp. ME02-6979.5a]